MRIAGEKAISITMEELEKSRFGAREPSIENRSRACPISLSLSPSAILVDHPLPTRARVLFISGRFHERVPRNAIRSRIYSGGLSLVSIVKSRGARGWTRCISQRKHRALLSSNPFARARADYLRNEKHSSCCWEISCSDLDTSRLRVVSAAYYFGISRGSRFYS